MRGRNCRILIVLLTMTLLAQTFGYGLTFPDIYKAKYNPVRKAARGVANLGTGWMEFFRQMFETKEKFGEVGGLMFGSFKGIFWTIRRVVVGTYEVTTFFFPPYKPILEPEFIIHSQGN